MAAVRYVDSRKPHAPRFAARRRSRAEGPAPPSRVLVYLVQSGLVSLVNREFAGGEHFRKVRIDKHGSTTTCDVSARAPFEEAVGYDREARRPLRTDSGATAIGGGGGSLPSEIPAAFSQGLQRRDLPRLG